MIALVGLPLTVMFGWLGQYVLSRKRELILRNPGFVNAYWKLAHCHWQGLTC